MERHNIFAGPYLDRTAHLRHDPAWFDAALGDTRSRVVPVWNSCSLVTEGDPRAVLLELSSLPPERRNAAHLVLLGRYGDGYCFAVEFDSAEAPQLRAAARFEDLRAIIGQLPADEAGLLGYARALVAWRRRNRFCGSCGAATVPARGGHVLVCVNPQCQHELFPRIDPAIIVLVSDGDCALLGRQAAWPAGRFSTIAGFVEPGESLEDAVIREVLEETGIAVQDIAYHSSQPWPFPASLMLGFMARAVTHEVRLNDRELEEARWFTRADLADGRVLFPSTQSISFRLIEQWFDAGGGPSLRRIHAQHMPDNLPIVNPRA
jgi:NAD+ diphosphatase